MTGPSSGPGGRARAGGREAAVVNSFADSFLTPVIALMTGAARGGVVVVNGQKVTYGAFLSQVITFVLTATVVCFAVVLPVKKIIDRRRRGEEVGPTQPTQVELLVEIRDLLRAQHGAGFGRDPSGSGTTTLPGQL